jgi:hypothetical protein
MSRQYTVRPTSPLTLAARVAKIEPLGNPVTVVGPEIGPTEVNADEVFDAGSAAGLRVVATSTARVVVTYTDEVE